MENPLNEWSVNSKTNMNIDQLMKSYVYYVCEMTSSSMDDLRAVDVHERLLEFSLLLFDVMDNDQSKISDLVSHVGMNPLILKSTQQTIKAAFERMFREMDISTHTVLDVARLNAYTLSFIRWFIKWLAGEYVDVSKRMHCIDQDLNYLKVMKQRLTDLDLASMF